MELKLKKSAKSRKKEGVQVLRDGYVISGDGVARRDVRKAINSKKFQDSAEKLISADLVH